MTYKKFPGKYFNFISLLKRILNLAVKSLVASFVILISAKPEYRVPVHISSNFRH